MYAARLLSTGLLVHARGAAVADGLGLGLWVGQREGTPQRQGEGGCGDDGEMHFGQWCVGGCGKVWQVKECTAYRK